MKFISCLFVKILISAGYPHQNGRYVEIIDLIDPYGKCEFVKDQPQKVQRYQKSSPKHSGKYVLTYQSTNLATFRNTCFYVLVFRVVVFCPLLVKYLQMWQLLGNTCLYLSVFRL